MSNDLMQELVARTARPEAVYEKSPIDFIKFDGAGASATGGKFVDKEYNVIAESPVNVQIVKFRFSLSFMSDAFMLSSSEYDNSSDTVTLTKYEFKEKDENGKSKKTPMGSATPKAFKEQYSNLKTVAEVYALMNGKMVKFRVKGRALAELLTLGREFTGADPMFANFITIASEFVQLNRAVSFYGMKLTRGEKANPDTFITVRDYLDVIEGKKRTSEVEAADAFDTINDEEDKPF